MLKKKLNALVAIEIIITMTLYYFILIGMTAVTYAIDVVKTNHTNVEFFAYFQNENGEKVEQKENNIDKEEYLYVEISVKNEGYLNNGEITLENNNFNIKADKLSEEVAEIKDNVVKLNQINAGSTVTIKLAIEAQKEDKINENWVNGKTKIELGGEYVNSKNVEKEKYIEIKGTDEVGLKWKTIEDTKIELEGKLLTNSIYDVEGENKRLVQMIVSSQVEKNSYPVKETEITLNVPEKVEEVKVTARETKGTNSQAEFGEGNYEYNREEKKLRIKIANEDKENISWEKEGKDTFVVTYVLAKEENIAEEEINIEDKVTLYDEREITENQNVHIEEEIDGVISSTIESSENEIYKGKIYSGEERDYIETNKINVDYIEAGDKVEIVQKAATYVEEGKEKEANILYKETKIKKDEFQRIFGDNGYLTIKTTEGTILANINKDSEVNEEGKIVITYPNGEKEIKIETSKPENIGTLNIENTKAIMNAGYGREEIKNITGIKEKTTVNSKVAEKEIELKETETVGSISLDTEKISTVAENQTLTVTGTLESNDESKDLYKNPTVKITIPKELTVKTAQYAILYKNGLEVEKTNSSKNNNGDTEITINLSGEQKNYDISGGTKICLKLEVVANKLTPSKSSQIEMKYTNENKKEEKTANAQLSFESQYGMMIYNQIANYNNNGDTLVTIDNETAYGELSTNADEKVVTLNTALINNYGENVTDVNLIGKIPAETNSESYVAKLNEIQTNNNKVKIYYSNKQDAEINDESWGVYNSDSKNYKIVVDEMEKEEVIKLNIPVTIPEKLKYNKKGTFSSNVVCNYQGNNEEYSSNIVLKTTSEIGTGDLVEKEETSETQSGIDVKIATISGNKNLSDNNNIYEGQTVKYKITVTNNTNKEYTNVSIKANEKNGYVWDYIEMQTENWYTGESQIEHYYDVTDKNEINLGTIEKLAINETYTYEYEAIAYKLDNANIDGNKMSGTITINSEDNELNETINTISNNIESAEISLKMLQQTVVEQVWNSESIVLGRLTISNLTDQIQNNIQANVVFSDNLDLDKNEIENIIDISEYENNVSIKGKSTNDKGQTVVTLEIASIEPNKTINIDISPYTKKIEEEKATIEMVAYAETENENLYFSNTLSKEIVNNTHKIEVTQKITDKNGQEVTESSAPLNDKEDIKITATFMNKEDAEVYTYVTYKIDDGLDVKNVSLVKSDGETSLNDEITENYLTLPDFNIEGKGIVKIIVSATVNEDKASTNEMVNTLNYIDKQTYAGGNVTNKFFINKQKGEPDMKDNEDVIIQPDDTPDNPDTPSNPDNSDNSDSTPSPSPTPTPSQDSNNQSNKYKVTGTVWIDKNKDGKKEDGEEKLANITVGAMSAKNGQIVNKVQTDSQGKYELELEEGRYIIIFYYNNDIYSVTTYQAKGIDSNENSDAIEKTISDEGQNVTVGATDELSVTSNLQNIDLGLVNKSRFNLEVKKYVSKITITNKEGTKTTEYDDKTLAKREIKAKYLNGSTVVIEYKIKVTNKGDLVGYAKDIVDYKPKDLKFNSSMNSNWYQSGDNIHTTSLSNTKIEPGETKELSLILTKTMTETNTGLVNNKAEITSSSNLLNIENENNQKGSADVIISVSTGALISYVSITISVLVLLGIGAYLINRKILRIEK